MAMGMPLSARRDKVAPTVIAEGVEKANQHGERSSRSVHDPAMGAKKRLVRVPLPSGR